MERIKKIAQGAALMTETEMEFKLDCGCYEFKKKYDFCRLGSANLIEAEKPEYTLEEEEFSKNCRKH